VVYATAISACGEAGQWKKALSLLEEARRTGVSLDTVTFNAAIAACARRGRFGEAHEVWAEMVESGVLRNLSTYHTLMGACAKAGKPDRVLILLRHHMRADGVEPDVMSYNIAMRALVNNGQCDRGDALFVEMSSQGLKPDAFSFAIAIDACAQSRDWRRAIGLLNDMITKHSLPADRVTFNAAINACAKAGEWREALRLLERMQSQGLVPDSWSYAAATEACGKGGCWQTTLSLLQEMIGQGLDPDNINYGTILNACRKARQHERALDLLEEMVERRGLAPDGWNLDVAIGSCVDERQWRRMAKLLPKLLQVGSDISAYQRWNTFLILGTRGASHDVLATAMAFLCREGFQPRDQKILGALRRYYLHQTGSWTELMRACEDLLLISPHTPSSKSLGWLCQLAVEVACLQGAWTQGYQFLKRALNGGDNETSSMNVNTRTSQRESDRLLASKVVHALWEAGVSPIPSLSKYALVPLVDNKTVDEAVEVGAGV